MSGTGEKVRTLLVAGGRDERGETRRGGRDERGGAGPGGRAATDAEQRRELPCRAGGGVALPPLRGVGERWAGLVGWRGSSGRGAPKRGDLGGVAGL